MERVALTVQRTDGVHRTGKGRLDAAGNKGRGTTCKAQTLLFGWIANPRQQAHALQPLHLVGTFKALVIGSSPDSPSPGNRLEQAVSDHPVRAGPRFSWAAAPGGAGILEQTLPLVGP